MNLTFVRIVSCAVVLAAAAAPALAQSEPSPAPTEIGRVFTSDRQDEPATATGRTTYVVTKDEMIRRGALTAADALEAVPGITLERYGPPGSATEAFVRGAAPGQTLVLIDGRPAGGVQTGTVDLGQIPTNGIERIEVVEGNGSTLYGSGAIGGVINLITVPQRSEGTRAMLLTGSLGENDLTVESPLATFERRVAGNSYAYPAIGPNAAGTRTNQDLEATNASLRLPFQFGAIQAYADAGLREQHLGVPGPAGFDSPTTRQNTTDGRALAGFVHRSGDSSTTLELSATRATLLYYSDPNDPNGCACYDLDVESRLQASLRQVFGSDRNRLVGGIDAARGSARIDAGDGNPPTAGFAEAAVYAQDSFLAGATRLYAGLRAERDGGYGSAMTPSFGTVVPLGGDLSVRANYSTGFRVPTIEDLYYPGFSNPNLLPERTAGGDLTLTSSAILGGASLGWFFLNGTDLISSNADFTSLVNVAKASIGGFTAEVRTKPLNGVHATVGATDLYRALDLTTTAARLPGRPVFTVNGGLEYLASDRSAVLSSLGFLVHSVGERDATGGAPAYSVVDAYLRARIAPRALLSLRAFNLGGERYAEVSGYPAPGRTFTVDLSTR